LAALVALGAAASGTLYSASALAQPGAVESTPAGYPACTIAADESATQAAQGAFQAGNASFNEADYPRAIVYWEDAYRRDCTAHLMLKNLARAYELHEQFAHAIVSLETFIERNPDSPEREALQRRIENLKQKLEERERAAAAAPPPKTEPEPQPQPVAQQPKRNLLDEQEQFPNQTDEPSAGRSALPLVFTGIGVAAGVVGGALWYVAKNDAASAEESCGGERRGCPDSVTKKGNDAVEAQRLWTVVGGVGAAVAVGGLIWYFAQPEDDAAARLTPVLGTEFAGLNYLGRF
jgi:hypothetical protein